MTKKTDEGVEATASKIRTVQGGFDPNRTRVLLYGESGVGKTVTASSFPKPILFLNADDGLASVRTEISEWPLETWEEVWDATKFLTLENHPFKTIVVDSLNEIQHMVMKWVIETYPTVKRSFDSLPSMADYGKAIADFDSWVRILKQLPCHIVFIAQVEKRDMDTDLVKPQLTGKNTASNIARMMDIIGYIYVGDESKRFIAFGIPDYVCKDRSDTLPPILELNSRDNAFDEISRYWRGVQK